MAVNSDRQIVAEKEKFRKNPSNFAVKQSKLEQAMVIVY